MAGYSGTPLPGKLGIKPGSRMWLINPPQDFAALLAPVPDRAVITTAATGRLTFDVIVLFARDRAALQKSFDRARARLDPAGGLWIAWPKKSSGITTDLSEDLIRDLALAAGLVDNKVCAIDDTWSGLRIVIRLKDRPATDRGRPGSVR
ncbi:MAG: DUF3052 family protein [Phycisphaerales bacterium]|nr:DUF3052 family protein [Phycisphaerales bacterium]